jgi:hypothetical protein
MGFFLTASASFITAVIKEPSYSSVVMIIMPLHRSSWSRRQEALRDYALTLSMIHAQSEGNSRGWNLSTRGSIWKPILIRELMGFPTSFESHNLKKSGLIKIILV